jgi:multiple sugar transport system substrate-binding protein
MPPKPITAPLPPAPVVSTPSVTAEIPVQKSPFRFLIPALGIGILVLLVILGVKKLISSKNTDTSTSNTAATQTATTTITYWGLWESSAIMKNTFAQFEAANPGIKVNYQQQSIKDYRERLQNALQNGEGPDLFRYHLTWTPMLVSNLAVLPESIISTKEFEAQQYPVAKTWLKASKGYVGVPLMYDGLGLYYNQAVLEAAGKTPPKTWEELRRLAVELTIKNKQGEIQRSGVALGTTSNVDNWSDIVGLMLVQNGADPGKPNTKNGQDALTFYTIFNTTYKVWDDTMPSSTIAFATEKVAMIIAPSWRALEIKDMNPNLKFNIAPLPQLPDSEVSWGSFWVEGVSSKTDKAKQTAAWKLIQYLNQKEVLRDWYASASKERLFGEIFARQDMADQLKTDPYVSAYLEQAANAKSWYLCSRTYDNGPNDKMTKYYEDAINTMITRGDTADKVLSTVESGITQVMNQYQLPLSTSTAR